MENSGFEFRKGERTFIFFKKPRLSLGPIQSPIYWVLVFIPRSVNLAEGELRRLPPSCPKLENEWSYTSTPFICHVWNSKTRSEYLKELWQCGQDIMNCFPSRFSLHKCVRQGNRTNCLLCTWYV